MQYNSGERLDFLLVFFETDLKYRKLKCGTNITTSMHAFTWLPLLCWHTLDFSIEFKSFLGRAGSSHFFKFRSNIKAEMHGVHFSFILQSTTSCVTSSCVKLPAQMPARVCDLQQRNSCHQSSLRVSALPQVGGCECNQFQ